MKTGIFFLGIFCAVLLTGCTTYYRDSTGHYLTRPESLGTTPSYTEFEVKTDRISATGKASVLFGIFQIAENKRCQSVVDPKLSVFSFLDDFISPTYTAVSNAKNVALYNACEKYNADQLVGVTFDYVIRNYFFFAKVDCTVKGFPANVKGVKMIDKKPIILNQWQKIEYVAPHEVPLDLSSKAPEASFSAADFFKK